MKQKEVIQFFAKELGVSEIDAINKVLKAKNFGTRFRMTGPGFVNSGWTGLIKALTNEGIKIYNVSRVNLVRYEDIVTISKALSKDKKEKSSSQPSVTVKAKPTKAKFHDEDFDDDDDYENDDDFDPYADEDDDIIEGEEFKQKIVTEKQEARPKKKRLHVPGSGSQFIPKKK